MQREPESGTELTLLNPIRVETALSRYPIHRLAKKGDIAIDLHEKDARGETTLKWRVTYNSGFGQPGPLAYKLDTLIINRKIEEATRPTPKLIRLGSLRDICRELGLNEGQATRNIKNALHQNASAYIAAKTTYRAANGAERVIELGDTRYGVIFTGETLPDGRKADGVYIALHDRYREILDNAITRPLDYDYLKSLPPAAQRFYEILSYQMYAALKYDRARAKLVYSELCTHAPLTRHVDWEKVRSQLNKVHRPHQRSGYIGKIEYQQTSDGSGQPDWIMNYMPGIKARVEYHTFTKRGTPSLLEAGQPLAEVYPLLPAPTVSLLEQTLLERGIHAGSVGDLVRGFTEEQIRKQMEILDWLTEKKPEKVSDPAAYLVEAIKQGYTAPKGFVSAAERLRRQEAREAKQRIAEEERRRKFEDEARQTRIAMMVEVHRKSCTTEQLAQLEAVAIAQASEETRRNLDDPAMRSVRKTLIFKLTNEHIMRMIQSGQQAVEPA